MGVGRSGICGANRSGYPFWCESFGGFLACESVGVVLVCVLRATPPGVSHSGPSLCVSRSGSSSSVSSESFVL
eukprot:6390162-Pyramimonas_sp.AAC.1